MNSPKDLTEYPPVITRAAYLAELGKMIQEEWGHSPAVMDAMTAKWNTAIDRGDDMAWHSRSDAVVLAWRRLGGQGDRVYVRFLGLLPKEDSDIRFDISESSPSYQNVRDEIIRIVKEINKSFGADLSYPPRWADEKTEILWTNGVIRQRYHDIAMLAWYNTGGAGRLNVDVLAELEFKSKGMAAFDEPGQSSPDVPEMDRPGGQAAERVREPTP